MAAKKFPKTVYVRQETEDDYTYLNTDAEVPDVDSNTTVGIYQLVEVAEIIVTREVKKQELKR